MYDIILYDTNGLGRSLSEHFDENIYSFFVTTTLYGFKEELTKHQHVRAIVLSFSEDDDIEDFLRTIKHNCPKTAVVAMYETLKDVDESKLLDGFGLFLYMVRKPVSVIDVAMFVRRSAEFYNVYKQREYLEHAINQVEKGFFVVDKATGLIEYMNDYAKNILCVDTPFPLLSNVFDEITTNTILMNGFNQDFLTTTLYNGESKKMFLETFRCNGSIIVEMNDYTELEGKLRKLEEVTKTFSDSMGVLHDRFGVSV